MYDDLASIEEGLAALVAELDPAVLHGSDALGALERACRITKLATTAIMLLGRRVDETGAWKPSGRASAAHLLANLSGSSLGEAMALLGTAKKMAKLPKTDDAARKGKLSGKQASEVSKGATADPGAEDDLLGLAEKASTSELTEESRRRRHAAAGDDDRRHARMQANRALHRFADDDGSAVMRWRHLPEVGAEVDAILDDYVDDEFDQARREHRREQRCAYAADALVAALRDAAAFRRGESIDDELDEVDDVDEAEASLDGDEHRRDPGPFDQPPPRRRRGGSHGPDGRTPSGSPDDGDLDASEDQPPGARDRGDPSRPTRRTRRDGQRSRRRRRTRRRGADAKVIVRIDHDALRRGFTEPGEICEIAGLGAVPVASVAALMEDAFLAAVIVKGQDVRTVVHLGRRPNAIQETAMQAAGVRCAVLGCPNTRRLERDHEEEWARTRHTRLDELDWLCEHDHDLKSILGYRLVPGTGPREFLSPEQQRRRGMHQPPRERAPSTPNPPPRTRSYSSTGRRTSPPAEALTLDL